MKRTLLVFLLVGFLSVAARAEDFQRVVLYQDMAFLTLERPAVDGCLVIECPPDLIPDSVTVAPVRGGSVRSMSIEPRRLTSGKTEQLKAALAEKRSLLEEKRMLRKTVERQIELIFGAAGVRDGQAPFSRTHLADALNFIDERVEPLNKRYIGLGGEIEALSTEVKDLEEQLAAVSRRPGYLITIETDRDGEFRVSYVVRGGSWSPEYAVHADPARGMMRIDASAVIRQATGTDWEVEELLVATGRPGLGIQAPEPVPWYIGMPRYRADSLQQKAVPMAVAPEEAAMDQDFEAEVKATSASYVIGAARSVRLPGDGTPSTVVLQKKQMQAEFMRLTCPRIDSGAFLRAAAVWGGNAPILSGAYSAYVDGEFMGRGVIGRTRPGEEFTVDLGRDEGIAVERKEKVFHEKTITKKDKTTYSYTITIRNARAHPVRVALKDQIPVSRDEAVRSELVKATPEAVPDEDGILLWELECAPGAEEVVRFSFCITGMPPW
ncbi:MAG TPA: DUF4139 domain-containing protein [Deltaproteobacteria bacterium]|nr:DUF4139 domain-containing protein [Deltaproteobacteria bacterium]